jgi:hypothetical protein
MLLATSLAAAQVKSGADWYESFDVNWTLSEKISLNDKATLQSPNTRIERDDNGNLTELELTHSGTSNFRVADKINFTGKIISATKRKNSEWHLECGYGNALIVLGPPLGPAKFNGVVQSLNITSSCTEVELIPNDGMAVLERGSCSYMIEIYKNKIMKRCEFANQLNSLSSNTQDATNIIEIARKFGIAIGDEFLMTVNEPASKDTTPMSMIEHEKLPPIVQATGLELDFGSRLFPTIYITKFANSKNILGQPPEQGKTTFCLPERVTFVGEQISLPQDNKSKLGTTFGKGRAIIINTNKQTEEKITFSGNITKLEPFKHTSWIKIDEINEKPDDDMNDFSFKNVIDEIEVNPVDGDVEVTSKKGLEGVTRRYKIEDNYFKPSFDLHGISLSEAMTIISLTSKYGLKINPDIFENINEDIKSDSGNLSYRFKRHYLTDLSRDLFDDREDKFKSLFNHKIMKELNLENIGSPYASQWRFCFGNFSLRSTSFLTWDNYDGEARCWYEDILTILTKDEKSHGHSINMIVIEESSNGNIFFLFNRVWLKTSDIDLDWHLTRPQKEQFLRNMMEPTEKILKLFA